MKKKYYFGVLVLLLAVVVLLGIYTGFKPNTTVGSKSITIVVNDSQGEQTTYQVNTDAEYLKEAMDDCKELDYAGEDSQYGLMVLEINGQKVDYEKEKSYWAFYVNGDYCQYGIESQVVNDKDVFTIEYTRD